MDAMSQEAIEIKIETDQTLDAMLHQILNQALIAIGAEAGSLMLVANKQGILQIKARLGKPRLGRKTEPVYKIDENSIAGWVVHNKRSYLCHDVERDKLFEPSRSGENFLSLLSVPVIHDDKVLAVINVDAAEKDYFTEKHRKRLEFVAQQVAAPVQERISILDALAEVGIELSRLPRGGGVEPVLEKIAQLAVRSLGADVVTIYPYIQERDEFPVEDRGPTIFPRIWDPSPMRRKVYPGDVPWTVVKERKSGFYSDVQKEDFLTREVERPGDTPRPRFVEREGIKSMAALLLPFRAAKTEAEEVVGVMFANYRTHHEFNIDEISALATFADYAAAAILNARREEQRRTEQVRMVESISAHFAHRMNSLAGISRVNAQLLRECIDPTDEDSFNLLDEIELQSKILSELAERLFRPFKETGRMLDFVPIDITRVLEEEIERVKQSASRIEISQDLPPNLPNVQSAEFQIREVLHNILRNAIEAMKEQEAGILMIRARYSEKPNCVEVEISDNGPGIQDDVRDKLFNPGVTTKKDSLGIGLWWCRTFMQVTGGNVILKDTWPGKGTIFAIEIPCTNETKEKKTTEGGIATEKKEMDILIVEDDDKWRNKLVGIVVSQKYRVETAATYAEARRILTKTNFKLVILDMRLVDSDPENKDGLRLLVDIANMGLNTNVIMITAYGTEQDKEIISQSPNILGFINKGAMDISKLRKLIHQAVNRTAPSSIN